LTAAEIIAALSVLDPQTIPLVWNNFTQLGYPVMGIVERGGEVVVEAGGGKWRPK